MERATARKCTIRDLLDGQYVQKEGAPNYVETPRGEISRINLIAAAVAKPGKRSLIIDDGTGHVEARAFDDESLFERVTPGSVVVVIGRPRQYEGQLYVVAEICKLLSGPKWLELRRAELGRASLTTSLLNKNKLWKQSDTADSQTSTEPKLEKKAVNETLKTAKGEVFVAITSDRILEIIRELDDGQGAAVEKVLAKAGRPDAETMLTNLLAEGEIFEIRPGRVKVLE